MNEIQSPPWQRVVAHVEEELKSLRSKLEKPDLSERDTQVVRGEIRALKRLLELPQTLAPQQTQLAPPGWPGGSDA